MGVTIVTVYENQKALIETKWFPLIHKYPENEVQFILVDNFSQYTLEFFAPKLPQLKVMTIRRKFINYDEALKMGVNTAIHKTILTTSPYAIPTYQTMVLLSNSYGQFDMNFKWMPKTRKLFDSWENMAPSQICADAKLISPYPKSQTVKTGTMYDERP